jgi:hypothetical protein
MSSIKSSDSRSACERKTKRRFIMFRRTLLVVFTAALVAALSIGCQTTVHMDQDGWYTDDDDDDTWARWRFSRNTSDGQPVQFVEDETVTVANADLKGAVALFKDVASYAETFNNADCRLLESLDEDTWLIYEFVDNPWPVADSDRVSQVTYQHDQEGMVVFRFYATPDAYPDQGVARQECYDVSYTITDLGDGRIELHERGEAITPVRVPDWLLKSAFPGALFGSLRHIKEILEQGVSDTATRGGSAARSALR